MDRNAVLAKTAKGVEELKSRAHGLAQRLRALLIVVDGTATAGEVAAKFGGTPEAEAGLQALIDRGFVESKGTRTAASPGPPPAFAPAPPRARQLAMSALTWMLYDALGPDADLLTGPVETARTRAEFAAAVARCAKMLEALAGKVRAQAFVARATAFADQHFDGA